MYDELEPIEPNEALDLYLDQRRNEVSEATLRSHKSRLSHFIRWCEQESINNMNDLSGRDLHEFRIWRRNLNGGIKLVTEKTQMDTLRVFIRFVERVDGVRDDLSEKVQSPDIDADDNTRDVILGHERVKPILAYLSKYQYASRHHIVLALQWHTMMRRGAVRALDLQDYDSNNQCVSVLHRPETKTPLKNQEDGERMVALSSSMCDLLDDWIDSHRPDVTDDFGREPLVATPQGRIHATTVTGIVYNWSRPCIINEPCPLNRDPDECEAACYVGASKCPESVSSHAVRRGSITHHLQSDVPSEVVSERANVGPNVLDQHYDRRSERAKMEQRRRFLRNI